MSAWGRQRALLYILSIHLFSGIALQLATGKLLQAAQSAGSVDPKAVLLVFDSGESATQESQLLADAAHISRDEVARVDMTKVQSGAIEALTYIFRRMIHGVTAMPLLIGLSAHGAPGDSFLYARGDLEGPRYSAPDLAASLAEAIPKEHPVSLQSFACHSGAGRLILDQGGHVSAQYPSYARVLVDELSRRGVIAAVSGAIGRLNTGRGTLPYSEQRYMIVKRPDLIDDPLPHYPMARLDGIPTGEFDLRLHAKHPGDKRLYGGSFPPAKRTETAILAGMVGDPYRLSEREAVKAIQSGRLDAPFVQVYRDEKGLAYGAGIDGDGLEARARAMISRLPKILEEEIQTGKASGL